MKPVVEDRDWPELSELFGITPRDVAVPPEEGGLTYLQLAHYLARLEAYRRAAAAQKG